VRVAYKRASDLLPNLIFFLKPNLIFSDAIMKLAWKPIGLVFLGQLSLSKKEY